MRCWVYKSQNKRDYFLYLAQPIAQQSEPLPQGLLDMLGDLHLILEFELRAEKNLARAEASDVLQHISQRGYYLQMPDLSEHQVH